MRPSVVVGLMEPVYLYAWVEDEPSGKIAEVLVRHVNAKHLMNIKFVYGFPNISHGYGNIKKKVQSFLEMAKQSYVLLVTDLDTADCPPSLIRNWLGKDPQEALDLPSRLLFRVAVREVEAWLLADRDGLARFLGISVANFFLDPEALSDPKQHL